MHSCSSRDITDHGGAGDLSCLLLSNECFHITRGGIQTGGNASTTCKVYERHVHGVPTLLLPHSQRSPRSHAHVLLAETSFSLEEIVGLTGLDIYQVVGLKLKMRSAA